MAYDEQLADRIRELVEDEPELTERKMFGGLAFLVGGNMAVAAGGKGAMMVRAGAEGADDLLDQPGASIVVMQDRPMTGWIEIKLEHLATIDRLRFWVEVGVGFARTLPAK